MLIRPAPVEVTTGDVPQASIIWLHGLGADAYDFVPIARELDLAGLPDIRFVFPNAAEIPVTLNGGYIMPAWYDIVALREDAPEDAAGIRSSAEYIEALIAGEVGRGIATNRIVLAGFSQGGVVALHTALRHPSRLAGAMSLSSYLALGQTLPGEAASANHGLPIFMAHGMMDSVVPEALARHSQRRLADLAYEVDWHSYPMGHSVCAEEIVDIGNWLRKVLPKEPV
jgi:phospholipase/carboxylesterase